MAGLSIRSGQTSRCLILGKFHQLVGCNFRCLRIAQARWWIISSLSEWEVCPGPMDNPVDGVHCHPAEDVRLGDKKVSIPNSYYKSFQGVIKPIFIVKLPLFNLFFICYIRTGQSWTSGRSGCCGWSTSRTPSSHSTRPSTSSSTPPSNFGLQYKRMVWLKHSQTRNPFRLWRPQRLSVVTNVIKVVLHINQNPTESCVDCGMMWMDCIPSNIKKVPRKGNCKCRKSVGSEGDSLENCLPKCDCDSVKWQKNICICRLALQHFCIKIL